jgi:putative nucleotidyltransferase with HDIG domain
MIENRPLDSFGDLFSRVRSAAPKDTSVYLVGGAIRDALLNRTIHDLDFALERGAIATARRLANSMEGAFFALDRERDTGRVIIQQENSKGLVLDFAAFRGSSLEKDLRDRDLTINAIALKLEAPEHLIDPLNGKEDLQDGILRACSSKTFTSDPLRIMRAVRMAVDLDFRISPETKRAMRANLTRLSDVSCERTRDELFRILDGPKTASAIRILDLIGALPYVLPELQSLKNVRQSPPHRYDVWNHSLEVLEKFYSILDVLAPQYNPDTANNWTMGFISLQLGRYRQQIHDHLSNRLNPQRSLRALLGLAALYHDIGKPETQSIDEDGRIRFFDHPKIGAEIAIRRAEQLHLSNHEIQRLHTIINHHMRPLLLAQATSSPSRRAIFRFFRDTQEAGVDICLLSLADMLGAYGVGIKNEIWTRQLGITRDLLAAWWEHSTEAVSPTPLLNGKDLIQVFNLRPGPVIGRLLDSVQEGQAIGEITSRASALDFARQWLAENDIVDLNNQG